MAMLYDTDFAAWAADQAEQLRQARASGSNLDIDWDNLIEEVEGLGKSVRQALDANLTRVIEHLLKLEHSPTTEPRNGWRRTVLEHRLRIGKLLRENPGLWQGMNALVAGAYEDGRTFAADSLAADGVDPGLLPLQCPYTIMAAAGTGPCPAALTGRRPMIPPGREEEMQGPSAACPFCRPAVMANVFVETRDFLAVYNIAPILPGHSPAIPRRHVRSVLDLTEPELHRFAVFGRRVTAILNAAFGTTECNWAIQEGRRPARPCCICICTSFPEEPAICRSRATGIRNSRSGNWTR